MKAGTLYPAKYHRQWLVTWYRLRLHTLHSHSTYYSHAHPSPFTAERTHLIRTLASIYPLTPLLHTISRFICKHRVGIYSSLPLKHADFTTKKINLSVDTKTFHSQIFCMTSRKHHEEKICQPHTHKHNFYHSAHSHAYFYHSTHTLHHYITSLHFKYYTRALTHTPCMPPRVTSTYSGSRITLRLALRTVQFRRMTFPLPALIRTIT